MIFESRKYSTGLNRFQVGEIILHANRDLYKILQVYNDFTYQMILLNPRGFDACEPKPEIKSDLDFIILPLTRRMLFEKHKGELYQEKESILFKIK